MTENTESHMPMKSCPTVPGPKTKSAPVNARRFIVSKVSQYQKRGLNKMMRSPDELPVIRMECNRARDTRKRADTFRPKTCIYDFFDHCL